MTSNLSKLIASDLDLVRTLLDSESPGAFLVSRQVTRSGDTITIRHIKSGRAIAIVAEDESQVPGDATPILKIRPA